MLLFQYFFCLVNCLPVAAAHALLCFLILTIFLAQYNFTEDETAAFCFKVV